MGGGLVADDFKPGQDACASDLLLKPARTLVLLGCSGNGKSATGNSILGREAFESKGSAAAVTKECELKTTKRPNGQIINVIDTPGLFSLFPSNESTIREILKCFRLAKEGINALLMVFSLRGRLTEEENSVLSVLKVLFGDDIVDYMIVVFTNEDSLTDNNETLDGYLKESSRFKEILAACNNRVVLFDNRAKTGKRKKAKKVQRLLDLVEEVVRKNNKKPFLFDLSHKTMEAEVEEKQKKIKAMKGHYTEEEKSNWKEEEENSPHHQFSQRVKKVEETRSWLKEKLNEEKTARREAETRAREEIRMLREKLQQAEKKLEKQEGGCIVL
ncbi:PREDICTED: immune-associated nucleotide-binding protein 8 [Camelina sativa]|uniref:Immune-associated nucleotide-binding protein 8 n=1 Tax=Camelina sativa TaxID=90675 RepID=A0ABM0U9G3_CAMSA|nr:PREDICTED: immune-associated nucleotide-binding protein 8 [Camelina sativa]